MYWCPCLELLWDNNELKRTQTSTVKLAGRNTGESGIDTKPLVPSNVNDCPTTPAALAVAPPCSVPLFVPVISLALPSPGHQPTRPATGPTQLPGALTVSVATTLVTAPDTFVTTTV